jgi:hypothetical protein
MSTLNDQIGIAVAIIRLFFYIVIIGIFIKIYFKIKFRGFLTFTFGFSSAAINAFINIFYTLSSRSPITLTLTVFSISTYLISACLIYKAVNEYFKESAKI